MTDRLLYSMDEAADRLGMCRRTLLAHVRAGDIRFVLTGKRTRKFAAADLAEFIEGRRQSACQSIDAKGRRTGNMTSRSKVYDFGAARKQRIAARRKASQPSSDMTQS